MEREIINRVTIIHTKWDSIGTTNKHGIKGVSSFGDRFRVALQVGHKGKKYTIGIFDTLEDAYKARRIAENHKNDGTLEEWIASKPSGHMPSFYDFWEREFEQFKS